MGLSMRNCWTLCPCEFGMYYGDLQVKTLERCRTWFHLQMLVKYRCSVEVIYQISWRKDGDVSLRKNLEIWLLIFFKFFRKETCSSFKVRKGRSENNLKRNIFWRCYWRSCCFKGWRREKICLFHFYSVLHMGCYLDVNFFKTTEID